jgi:hypothetical protein
MQHCCVVALQGPAQAHFRKVNQPELTISASNAPESI